MNGERIIQIESINPVEFFGINNTNIDYLLTIFPQLKVVVRGNEIKALGAEKLLDDFGKILDFMMLQYDRFGVVHLSDVKQIVNSGEEENNIQLANGQDEEVLVYGRSGKVVKALTVNQKRMVESIKDNDMIFAIGPAGTGKTYTAVALAVRALKNREVRRIVLTRPAVEAGESLGFLPGDLRDKLDPYLQPLYDALRDMIPQQKLLGYFDDNTIEIAPLAFMRGRTLDNAFVILDEAQNATPSQIKMFLTRMGKSAKFVITGDITQIDLPKHQKSGLVSTPEILKDIKGIDFIYLDDKDVVRHKLVSKIIEAYNKVDFSN